MTIMEPAGKVRVPSADDMDLDVFCLHMTARHEDSLGGLSRLDPDLVKRAGLEEPYREFHHKLHFDPLFGYRQFDHDHREPRP